MSTAERKLLRGSEEESLLTPEGLTFNEKLFAVAFLGALVGGFLAIALALAFS